MRRSVLTMLAVVIGSVFIHSVSLAAPWAVVTGYPTSGPYADQGALYTIDLGVAPPVAYGPLLVGQLGSKGGSPLELQMLPDGHTALVSVFGDATIYKVDLTNPKNPVILDTVVLYYPHHGILFAEDVALSPDGRLALVSDGGFSTGLSFIDLASFNLNRTFNLGAYMANAVAVAPGNNTVILADYFYGVVNYGVINENQNKLVNINSIILCEDPVIKGACSTDHLARPVNVAISPDGQTALVASAANGLVNVLRITGPGMVEPGNPFFLWGLPGKPNFDDPWIGRGGGNQSIAFSPDGELAYVVSQPTSANGRSMGNRLSVLRITGPGQAEVANPDAARLPSYSTCQFFGVDVLGVSKDGTTAVVGNPCSGGTTTSVGIVNLGTSAVTAVPLKNNGNVFGAAFIE